MPWATHVAAAAIASLLTTGSTFAAGSSMSRLLPNNYPRPGIESRTPATLEPTYRLHSPQAILRVVQYARRIPGDPSAAGNYYILASVTNSSDQYPNGALIGSTCHPLVTSDDRVSFPITTDKDTHHVTVETPMLRWKMVDPDSTDLVIIGFPIRNQQLWSSDSQCRVGRWQPATEAFYQESIPTLGYTKRDIECYG